MDENPRKHYGQIEIADLISEAVSNATARRNQVLDSEEPLSSLSDEQAESLKGGQIISSESVVCGGIMRDLQDIILGRFV